MWKKWSILDWLQCWIITLHLLCCIKKTLHFSFEMCVDFYLPQLALNQTKRTNWNIKENNEKLSSLFSQYFLFIHSLFWVCFCFSSLAMLWVWSKRDYGERESFILTFEEKGCSVFHCGRFVSKNLKTFKKNKNKENWIKFVKILWFCETTEQEYICENSEDSWRSESVKIDRRKEDHWLDCCRCGVLFS